MIIILVMIIIKPCVPIMVVGAAEYNDGCGGGRAI